MTNTLCKPQWLLAYTGNDTLDAGENYGSVDRLYGESGDDTFLAKSFYGHGIYDGGTGVDLIDFSQSTGDSVHRRAAEGAGVQVNLATGLAHTYSQQNGGLGLSNWLDYYGQIELSNIENVRGTAQGDHITGDANANVMDGGAGSDTLLGGDGNDALFGGTGNDLLYGDNGNDTFTFSKGDGRDTIYVAAFNGTDANETLVLRDINSTEVNLIQYDGSLYVQQKGSTTDHVKIVGHFGGGSNALDKLIFADGLTWDAATINANSVEAQQDPEYV